jgi:hypothetical protein
MRVLLAVLIAAGLALLVVGAIDPQLFVLSLLGMLLLTGTAAVAVAGTMQRVGPHAPQ